MNRIHWMGMISLCLACTPVMAGDVDAGRVKAEVACQTCHGMDGQATQAMVPHLSGQQQDYLVIQLEAYRSGQRQHAQMYITSQMLSDEDIRNLAAWYAGIPVTVQMPSQ